MSIYVFYTEIWSCIPYKRSTCSMTAGSRDPCFFATTVTRRSIGYHVLSWSILLPHFFLADGQMMETGTAFFFFWYKAFWFQSNYLNRSSNISVRTSELVTPCLLGAPLLKTQLLFSQAASINFCWDFLDAFSVCWSDAFLVSLPREQYSATCMLTQPVIKPSTYTVHS